MKKVRSSAAYAYLEVSVIMTAVCLDLDAAPDQFRGELRTKAEVGLADERVDAPVTKSA